MLPNNFNNKIYAFGSYQLDMKTLELKRESAVIPLSHRSAETLSILIENRDRVVTKEELMKALWPDTFVEENNLTQHISQIRRVLNEGSSEISYIKTVPKRGYKFIADANVLSSDVSYSIEPEIEVKQVQKTSFPYLLISALSLIGLLIAFVAYYSFNARSQNVSAKILENPKFFQLTDTGNINQVSISHNGKYVAYAVQEGDKQSLHISQITGNNSVQITSPAEITVSGISFSLDDQHIYYTVKIKDNNFFDVFKMPFLGGKSDLVISNVSGSIAFSPDGKRTAFIRYDPSQGETSLIVTDTNGSNERKVTSKKLPQKLIADSISWSPDGKYIVCGKYVANSVSDANIVGIDPDTGREFSLIKNDDVNLGAIHTIDWFDNSDNLIFSGYRSTSGIVGAPIMMLSLSTGEIRQITNENTTYLNVRASSATGVIAARKVERLSRLWTGKLSNSGLYSENVTEGQIGFGFFLSHNSGLDWVSENNLVFSSQKGGKSDIWTSDRTGKNQRQITNDQYFDKFPIATTDGRYIVFVSEQKGRYNIWKMDVNGNNRKQLTFGTGETFPNLTPDNKFIIYMAVNSGDLSIWKVSIDGGTPIKISDQQLHRPKISPDGKWITASKSVNNLAGSLVLMSAEGGEPRGLSNINQQELEMVQWAADNSSLLFVKTKDGISNLWSQPINGGEAKQLTNFTSDRIFRFAQSPDGKSLACERGINISDVVIIR